VITSELERAGIPTAHVCTMTPVAEMVGSHRIVTGNGIVHPLGGSELSPAEERKVRRQILERALESLRRPGSADAAPTND
jgi:betaine reductase